MTDDRTPADPLDLARLRAQIRDIDTSGMDLDQITAAVAAHDARMDALQPWLLPGTDTVDQTSAALVAAARTVADDTVLGEALGEVLNNASAHLPAFFERSDGTPAPRPYGCTACGCADGTGACDTWLSGLRLAAAILSKADTEWGRVIVDDSCGNGHLTGHVPAVYRTRERALAGGNGLGLFPDQRLVSRFATAWQREDRDGPGLHGQDADAVVVAVREALANLDGTDAAALGLLTGYSPAALDDLGGLPARASSSPGSRPRHHADCGPEDCLVGNTETCPNVDGT